MLAEGESQLQPDRRKFSYCAHVSTGGGTAWKAGFFCFLLLENLQICAVFVFTFKECVNF